MNSPRAVHYAWIILALCFLTLLSAQGMRYSFGAFVTTWEVDFDVGRGTIASVSFTSYLLYGITQPAIGRLAERWGGRRVLLLGLAITGVGMLLTAFARDVWQLILLYGVLGTIGFSMTSPVVASVLITRWFNARRGFAFGLIEAGAATGQMLIVPGSVLLIARLGWRDTSMLFAAGLVLVVLPLVALLVHSAPQPRGMRALGELELPSADTATADIMAARSPLLTRNFWLLMLPFFICGTTTTGLMDTHLIPLALDTGFDQSVASLAVVTLAAFNIAGTLISALIADRIDSGRLLGWIYALRTLTLVLLLFVDSPIALVVFAAFFGLVDFATLAPTQLLASRLFERQGAGTVFGWLFMSHHVGSAIGSFVPGLIHDSTGGYDITLYGSMGLLVIASWMSFSLVRGRPAAPDAVGLRDNENRLLERV